MTSATRTGRKLTVTRDGQTFECNTTKPFAVVWLRGGILKASPAASLRAAQNGAKVVATNAADTDIEVVEVQSS